MDARITRLEEHVADLRGDVAKLQEAERSAKLARDRKSAFTTEVMLYSVQMIAVFLAGMALGVALAIDPDHCNRANGDPHACVEETIDQAKSPATVERDDAP